MFKILVNIEDEEVADTLVKNTLVENLNYTSDYVGENWVEYYFKELEQDKANKIISNFCLYDLEPKILMYNY